MVLKRADSSAVVRAVVPQGDSACVQRTARGLEGSVNTVASSRAFPANALATCRVIINGTAIVASMTMASHLR